MSQHGFLESTLSNVGFKPYIRTSSLVSATVEVEVGGGTAEGAEVESGRLADPSLKLGFLDTSEFLRAVTFLASVGL